MIRRYARRRANAGRGRLTDATRAALPAAVLSLWTLAVAACGPAPASPAALNSPPADAAAPTHSPMPTPTATPRPTPTATPAATPSSVVSLAGTYLALGDSLAGGVGASDPNRLGYVVLLFERLNVPGGVAGIAANRLANVAVGGETSSSFIEGGQLATAVRLIAEAEPPVSLVTLDIGGNDLLRLLNTEPCTSAPASAECGDLVNVTLDAFAENAARILGDLRRALDEADSAAPLAVMTYFNPFSGTDDLYEAAADRALLGADGRADCETARQTPGARGMNDIIACLAEEHGAVLVDVEPLFAGLGLELTHIGSQDIHGNDTGYAVIANAFAEALTFRQ